MLREQGGIGGAGESKFSRKGCHQGGESPPAHRKQSERMVEKEKWRVLGVRELELKSWANKRKVGAMAS